MESYNLKCLNFSVHLFRNQCCCQTDSTWPLEKVSAPFLLTMTGLSILKAPMPNGFWGLPSPERTARKRYASQNFNKGKDGELHKCRLVTLLSTAYQLCQVPHKTEKSRCILGFRVEEIYRSNFAPKVDLCKNFLTFMAFIPNFKYIEDVFDRYRIKQMFSLAAFVASCFYLDEGHSVSKYLWRNFNDLQLLGFGLFHV